jgi:hypothetical protein
MLSPPTHNRASVVTMMAVRVLVASSLPSNMEWRYGRTKLAGVRPCVITTIINYPCYPGAAYTHPSSLFLPNHHHLYHHHLYHEIEIEIENRGCICIIMKKMSKNDHMTTIRFEPSSFGFFFFSSSSHVVHL